MMVHGLSCSWFRWLVYGGMVRRKNILAHDAQHGDWQSSRYCCRRLLLAFGDPVLGSSDFKLSGWSDGLFF